jgi:diguanylate cyclase (GGDEF)-like protein
MKLLAALENRSPAFWMVVGLAFVVGVGAADFWTGSELAFSLFYLIPVVLVTWFKGRFLGMVIAIASAATWLAADALAGHPLSQPFIRYWNAFVRLAFFALVTLLLPALKELEQERRRARIDDLTGAANRRLFFEVLQMELDRSQRYKRPFAIAYIDIDGFKAANDRLGHHAGDQILCAVVRRATSQLRKTDMLARLGGDEFVLLLPETDTEASKAIVSRLHAALLDEMGQHQWPVTFSIGVVACQAADLGTDELIRKADELMYSVKRGGRNAVAYAAHPG